MPETPFYRGDGVFSIQDENNLKLYLDLCVYNRPFDYQGQERVALETGTFIYLLEKIEKGSYTLIVSEALTYENNKSLNEQRKARIASYFSLAREFVEADLSVMERVNALKELGVPDIDALHVALAEKARADYFVTCDDDLIKLYKRHEGLVKVKIVTLIELVSLEVR